MGVTKGESYEELTAAEITKDALLMLQAGGCCVRRHNNHATRGRQNNTEPGYPDIAGYNRSTGLAVYCEVKKIGDTLKDPQIEFLTNAHLAGCVSMIATQRKDKTVLIDFLEYYKP